MLINELKWGDDSAEKDPNLMAYFIESDAYARLKNKSKNIVIGRKGSGKSALRKKMEEHFQTEKDTVVVNIAPKYSSVKNILNDQDLSRNFGEEIFFQHTWLRNIYLDSLCQIGQSAKGKLISGSFEFARNTAELLKRSSKDIVENIADVLSKIKIKAGSLGELGLQLDKQLREVADADSLEFHIKEICNSGQKIVVLVDDLDLGWDNSQLSNNMLLGLFYAIDHLAGISKNIYPCIFLREDVYSILIARTQHSDKYRNVERIRWDKTNLMKIVNSRINFNRKEHQMPELEDPFSTVFPTSVGTSYTDNWLIDRTLARPRELLQLCRYYSETVTGDGADDEALKSSEANYSSWKLDDLCAEYSNKYPDLVNLFSFWKTTFYRSKYHLDRKEIESMLMTCLIEVQINKDWFNEIAAKEDYTKFLEILYEIGFIGDFILGGDGGSKVFYSFDDVHKPLFREIQFHPCFRRAINTVSRIHKS